MSISLDAALLIVCLGIPLVACVLAIFWIGKERKHLQEMREASSQIRAKRLEVEESMRRGARMTDHRFKP